MLFLKNDYSEGCHPSVLKALSDTNMLSTVGYGLDEYSEAAAKTIRSLAGDDKAAVHFLPGGTITNLTFIAAALKPWQAVIAPSSGHINIHETGAVEATGHKILTVPAPGGKLTPALADSILQTHSTEHMVEPALVYISNLTELGTAYTKSELENLSDYCRRKNLLLFIDGARLGCAMAVEPDLTYRDFYELSDAFYIGGTKNGLLFGEALVIRNAGLDKYFRHMIKRQGAMMAKGRLIPIMFSAIFEDDGYMKCARHSVDQMDKIRAALEAKNIPLFSEAHANMIFPLLTDEQTAVLEESLLFEREGTAPGGRNIIRFVTSWATSHETVDAVISLIQSL